MYDMVANRLMAPECFVHPAVYGLSSQIRRCAARTVLTRFPAWRRDSESDSWSLAEAAAIYVVRKEDVWPKRLFLTSVWRNEEVGGESLKDFAGAGGKGSGNFRILMEFCLFCTNVCLLAVKGVSFGQENKRIRKEEDGYEKLVDAGHFDAAVGLAERRTVLMATR